MVSSCNKISKRASRRSNRSAKESFITKRRDGSGSHTNVSNTVNANCSLFDVSKEICYKKNENVKYPDGNYIGVSSAGNYRRRFGIDVTNRTKESIPKDEILKRNCSKLLNDSLDFSNLSDLDKLKIVTSTPVVVLKRIKVDSSNKAKDNSLPRKSNTSSVCKHKSNIKRKDLGKLKITASTPVVVLKRIKVDSFSNEAKEDSFPKKSNIPFECKDKINFKRKEKYKNEIETHSKMQSLELFNTKSGSLKRSKKKEKLVCDHILNVKKSSEDFKSCTPHLKNDKEADNDLQEMVFFKSEESNHSFKLFESNSMTESDDVKVEQVVTRPLRKRNTNKMEMDDSSDFQRLQEESPPRKTLKKKKAVKNNHDDDHDKRMAEMLRMKEMEDIFDNHSLLVE